MVFQNISITDFFCYEYENENYYSVFIKDNANHDTIRFEITSPVNNLIRVIDYLNEEYKKKGSLKNINFEQFYHGEIYTNPEYFNYTCEEIFGLVQNGVISNKGIVIKDEKWINSHIKGVFEKICHVDCNRDEYGNSIYSCCGVKTFIKAEKFIYDRSAIYDDVKNNIELSLYISIFNNFDVDKCKYAWEYIDVPEPDTIHHLKFSNELLYSYNTLKGLRAWHFFNGCTRVGKDDFEWFEDTYIIPLHTGYRLDEELIEFIKKELNIDFEYQEDFCRYYCFILGEKEQIPGCYRKGDCYSEEFTKKTFCKILYLMFLYFEKKQNL